LIRTLVAGPGTEDTAAQRLMGSAYVGSLLRATPSRHLMCMVEITRPDSMDLYLGDDEGDHTTRVRFCRVTRDGRVWVNRDETGLDDRWAVVEQRRPGVAVRRG